MTRFIIRLSLICLFLVMPLGCLSLLLMVLGCAATDTVIAMMCGSALLGITGLSIVIAKDCLKFHD